MAVADDDVPALAPVTEMPLVVVQNVQSGREVQGGGIVVAVCNARGTQSRMERSASGAGGNAALLTLDALCGDGIFRRWERTAGRETERPFEDATGTR